VATSNVQNLDSKFKKKLHLCRLPDGGLSAKGTVTGVVWPSYLCRLLVFADWLAVGKDILCRLLGMTDCSQPTGNCEFKQSAKVIFADCPCFGWRQRPGLSAKWGFPVVPLFKLIGMFFIEFSNFQLLGAP
jgi:hypothetical protein